MYVNRLIEFADRHSTALVPLGFKMKKMDWIGDIAEDGISFTKVSNNQVQVPDIARSSGTAPILIVDKADYVLGVSDTKKNEARSQERHNSYMDLLESYLDEFQDKDIDLLYQKLKDTEAIKKAMEEKDIRMNHNIYFRIRDEDFPHESEMVRSFWEAYVKPQKIDNAEDFYCMHCGEIGPVMQRHSINFLIGPDRTKLISANETAYESQGLKNSQIAPTCYICEQKYGKALEYLLERYPGKKPGGPHMFRLGDLTYVHWMRGDQQLSEGFNLMLTPDKEQGKQDVKDLIEQVFTGQPVDRALKDFCILTLSANKGRLVVRDYSEDSAAHLKERIQQFFFAQDVGADRYYGIYTLAATMYVDASKQMQKHALKEWMDWFLHGKALSQRIILPILRQVQVSGVMYAHQAAAIQSWIVSQENKMKYERGTDNMLENKGVQNPSYVIGRLFAVLEKIQQTAINSSNTIATKHFSAASTTPKSVMGGLIRNAQHHLTKIGNEEGDKGLAIYYDKKLAEIYAELEEYPNVVNAEGQAEFAMGYYHEKKDLYTSKKDEEEHD